MVPDSFRAVIDCWPTRAELRRDVVAWMPERKPPSVRMWYADDSIPHWWFPAVVRCAHKRGLLGITKARLDTLRRARWPE
jgi:hypothetical protein